MENRLREILQKGKEPHLMTSAQYKESLRDGRNIIDAEGNKVEDVTTHPAFKNSIELLGELYDQQFDPETRNITTYYDPKDGKRYSTGWLLPENIKELEQRRDLSRLTTYHTFGLFGRPNDYGSMKSIGLLMILEELKEHNECLASNIKQFIEFGRKHNIISIDLAADVQGDRSLTSSQKESTLRIVEERSDGVILSGAKAVASLAPQAHFFTSSTSRLTPQSSPNEALWFTVPANAKGLTMVLRESVTNPSTTFEDHPINSKGEEMDNLLIFDKVFIPNKYLFSIKNLDLVGIYGRTGIMSHWLILSRLMYRAEIFAGVAQLIVDVLGTNSIQGVRESVSKVVSYAATLRAFVIASEKESHIKNGVRVPSEELVTSGRLYSIVHYPEIMQILRDLSGQGLVSRFTSKTWNHPEIKDKLNDYLKGENITAEQKNRFFNFVWDLTSSGHAMRVALFENLNSTSEPLIRSHLYNSYELSRPIEYIKNYLDLPSLN